MYSAEKSYDSLLIPIEQLGANGAERTVRLRAREALDDDRLGELGVNMRKDAPEKDIVDAFEGFLGLVVAVFLVSLTVSTGDKLPLLVSLLCEGDQVSLSGSWIELLVVQNETKQNKAENVQKEEMRQTRHPQS